MTGHVGSVDLAEREVPAPGSVMVGLSSMISRMKLGVPLIRRIESCAPDRNEMTLCIAFLSDDLQTIKFVKSDDAIDSEIAVSTLKLCNVEEVAQSNTDRLAVGLLLPKLELIIELIFASPDDARIWFTVVKLLSSREATIDEVQSATTEIQGTDPSVDETPDMELMELVSQLQNQNESLKDTLTRYDSALDDMKRLVEVEKEARRVADDECTRLRRLLLVREDTITELSMLVQTLLRQQTVSIRRDSVMTTIRPHQIAAPTVAFSKQVAGSTPPTSLGSLEDMPDVLQSLSGQLQSLEERKQQLERMLEAVSGL